MDFEEFVLAAVVTDLADEPAAREHADAVEFRMDLAADPLPALDDYDGELPVIATNRAAWEGGEADDDGRIDALAEAARSDGVAAVDVELAALTGDGDGDVDGPSGEGAEALAAARANDTATIVSTHDFEGTPDMATLAERLGEACSLGDVGKLAVTAEDRGDDRECDQGDADDDHRDPEGKEPEAPTEVCAERATDADLPIDQAGHEDELHDGADQAPRDPHQDGEGHQSQRHPEEGVAPPDVGEGAPVDRDVHAAVGRSAAEVGAAGGTDPADEQCEEGESEPPPSIEREEEGSGGIAGGRQGVGRDPRHTNTGARDQYKSTRPLAHSATALPTPSGGDPPSPGGNGNRPAGATPGIVALTALPLVCFDRPALPWHVLAGRR